MMVENNYMGMQFSGLIEDLQGAIFDMDGLLVNSEDLYAKANYEAAKDAGLDLPKNFYEELTGSSLNDMQAFYDKHFKTEEQLNAFIKETDDLVWKWATKGQLKLRPGVLETLEVFKTNGVKMGIASSNYQNFVEHFIDLTGIDGYFDFYFYYGIVSNPKPAPDVFLLAQEKLALPKENILIFEDSSTGVLAAKNAGIKVVMVPFLTEPTEADQENADLITPSFNEFLRLQ